MKNIFILSLIYIFSSNVIIAQSCLPEGIRFRTQAEIDNFSTNFPGCTEILGDVTINDISTGNLTNLDGLENLVSVGGDFSIGDNPLLSNLDGFNNLNTLNGLLSIYNNLDLISINGFNGLTSIGDFFECVSNEALPHINGFQNVRSINGQFQIDGNFMLRDIDGFSKLQSIGSYVVFDENISLTGLGGLSQLQTIVGSLRISFNHDLTNLDPLNQLTSIGTTCRIFSNGSLGDCAIEILCDGGTQIGGEIDIFNNAVACQNLEQIYLDCHQETLLNRQATVPPSSNTDYPFAGEQLNGTGVADTYTADYFELSVPITLHSLDIFGKANAATSVASNFTGFSVYIYDNANGVPNGNPITTNNAIVSLPNIQLESGFTILRDQNQFTDIRIDFTQANGGEFISLPPGEYWLLVAPRHPLEAADPAGRWDWLPSDVVTNYSPKMIKPLAAASSQTEWEDVSSFSSEILDINTSMSWVLKGTTIFNIDVIADDNSIGVYPRQTSNNLYTLMGDLNNYLIDIVNRNGQVVQTINPIGLEETLDLSTIPTGLHFIRMINVNNASLSIELNIKE